MIQSAHPELELVEQISTGQFSTYVLMYDSAVPLTNFDSDVAKAAKTDDGTGNLVWKILFWIIVGLDIGAAIFYVFKEKDLLSKIKIHIRRR